MDHHNYFAAVEPIFWKHGGRPHWGKLHNLGARQLSALYPRWKEFTEVRAALDPQGKFLNGHLRTVFGV
jgi:FAD/FMN-containing dehydrogenase